MKLKSILALAAAAVMAIPASWAVLPSTEVPTLEGKTVNLSALPQGKPVVLSFFATWCKPCRRELNAVSELYDDWREDSGVDFYAVSIDKAQDLEKVRSLVSAQDWPFPVLLDANGDLQRTFGARMVPTTVLIDGQGNVVSTHTGYNDGDEEELYKNVKALVK